ncbi:hypothetical protein AAMO2058_000549200 [Amorphochlora amoebiformis]
MRLCSPCLLLIAYMAPIRGQRFAFDSVDDLFQNGKPTMNQDGIIVGGDGESRKILPNGISIVVDARFEELLGACVDGDLKMVKEILKARPHSINHRSVVMPIHAAVQHRRKDIVVWLIEHGASVDSRTEDGSTAVALAAYNGDLELTKMLTERGANAGIKNQQGYNAIEVAQMQGYPEIHEYLTTAGRLQNAAKEGDLPTLKRMLKKKPWRVNEVRLYAPLHAAALFNHTEMAKWLLTEGANVDVQMLDASTPIILAASEGNEEMVKLLLFNDADISHVNYVGYDVYKAAIHSKNVKLANYIASFIEKPEDEDAEASERVDAATATTAQAHDKDKTEL